MKRIFLGLTALVGLTCVVATPAVSQALDCVGGDLCCDNYSCTSLTGIGSFFRDDYCRRGGVYFQGELLLFQYLRADGVRAGSFNNVPPNVTDDLEFGYEAAPRITLGYVTAGGLGFRTRWFEYDHSGTPVFPATGVQMDVDTYTIDLELFERFSLNNAWEIEMSGGVRYNEFEEFMLDPIPAAVGGGPSTRTNSFSGWGGIAGIEGVRSLGRFGGLYARGRGALLMGDKFVANNAAQDQQALLRDTTLGATELAVGYEFRRNLGPGLFTFRSGYEWQNWFNYSSAFAPFNTAPANDHAQFGGQSDVGFHGATFLMGFER